MSFLENKIPPPFIGILCALLMWWTVEYLPILTISTITQYSLIALFVALGFFFDLAGII